ncbi:MAG: peptidoglycan DD-metalloendopeptidase family protein [Thiohalobacterales bacterium]|nr:peptidoglycan DD-metalloendopeptidase family protein [Thiohalobacterales bacterium]
MRSIFLGLLLAILQGCASTAQAPVHSRGVEPEPRPTISYPDGSVAARPATPVTRAARPITRPVVQNSAHYTVQRGDTLYSVAWKHGLAVTDLARLNNIRPPYTIYPGQSLRTRGQLQPLAPVRQQPLPEQNPQTAAATSPVPRPAVASPPSPATPSQTARPAARPAITEAAAGQNALAYDGNWVWPTRGRILRSYKENTPGKQGIDIGGHHAQPVKAAAGGRVVYAGSGLVGYGRLIIVKHNENLLSAYGHNSKLLVAEGDNVKAGDVIAKMGSSGTDRTALYFEIRKHGKPVNPLHYLPRN